MLSFALLAALVPVRVDHAPRVDGHLDDALWQVTPASDAFTQSFPHDGDKPTSPTSVRVAYDDDNIYVAIECTQTFPLVARLTRRDREIDGDRVSIDIDTSRDRRGAFHFQVSAAGVMVDALRYDDTDLSIEWDEIWRAEVAPMATGWSAELAIPLRILRLRNGVDTWGFQVRRYVGESGEIDTWAYSPRDAGGEVSRYGDLGPFNGLSPRGSIALVPFALSRVVRTDPSMPSQYGDGVSGAGGIDMTWKPASSVTLAAAVLPDFAQVEADQVVINLTTTETEYPEKRPFFLQGLDVFATPIQLFYSRRIEEVLGAGKLLASYGAFELGALSALTDDRASHHVVRMRGTAGGGTIGVLGTAQMQDDPMLHDSLTGAVDGAWRSSSGAWVVGGQVAGSQRQGGEPEQRPDGTLLMAGDSGAGTNVHVAKEGGTLRASLAYEGYSRRFAIDDLGYLPRANVHRVGLDLEAYTAHAHGPMLESRSRIEIYGRRNLDGLVLPSGYQWNVSGTAKGMWELFMELHWRPQYFDDREFGDGRALQRSGRLGLELGIRSDPRRAVVGAFEVTAQSTHAGSYTAASSSFSVRPRDDIELTLEPELLVARGEPRFLEDDPFGPRFARQDASSFGVTTRAIWTLQRDLTLQAYVQALLATIRYRDAFVADPLDRVVGLDDLQPGAFDPTMYDAREGALNATAVARWEYRPGSTAFLVYSHAQVPTDERATWEPAALVRGPQQDVVLLKLSWAWLR
jgi:hypothetical protein